MRSLAIATSTKDIKCLDISTGHVYISRNVIFDENVFPFAALHSNASSKYTSDALLLLSSSISRENIDVPMVNYPTNTYLPVQNCFIMCCSRI
jgi:hypothetical protein